MNKATDIGVITREHYTDWQVKIAQALVLARLDMDQILHRALSLLSSSLCVGAGALVALEDDGTVIQGAALHADIEPEEWLPLLAGEQEWVVIDDLHAVPHLNVLCWETGTAALVPLMSDRTLRGALLLLHPEPHSFDDDMLLFLQEVGAIVAAALDNAVLYRRAQKVQADAEGMEQMRRDLTAMIYHDLRGPLLSVQASLSGLNRVINSADRSLAEDFIHLGQQNLRRLTRMVKSLLDIERLEAGQAAIHRKRTALRPLFDEALDLIYPLAQEARQDLVCEIDDELPQVEIDADMILRVVTNLMENAIKHTPPGGRISVRAAADGDAVRTSVIDTGAGIPPSYREAVFNKYFRLQHAEAPNGAGLGLAYCRLAVEAHGGRIWVEGEPGGGAVFAFTVPMHEEK
jgi:signal transduction histidine kinase